MFHVKHWPLGLQYAVVTLLFMAGGVCGGEAALGHGWWYGGIALALWLCGVWVGDAMLRAGYER